MPEYVSKAGGVGLAYVLTVDDTASFAASSSIDTGSFLITASFLNPFLSFSKGDGTEFTINLETLVPINALTASFVTASNVYGPYGSNSVISASWAHFAVTASYVPPYGAAASPPETSVQFNSGGFFEGRPWFTYEYGTESLQQGIDNNALGYWSHAQGTNTWTGQYGYLASSNGATWALDAGYGDLTSTFSQVSYVVAEDVFLGVDVTTGAQIYSCSFDGTNTILYPTDPNVFLFGSIGIIHQTQPSGADQLIRGSSGSGLPYDGNAAHSEGINTIAVGYGSHAEGIGTEAAAKASHVEGVFSRALGYGSHAEGGDSVALGFYSHAEGSSNAIGSLSHAEGSQSLAIGTGSHAEGYQSIACGSFSHAEGYQTRAQTVGLVINFPGHSEGAQSNAFGGSSRGIRTISAGGASHAEGVETTAGFLGFVSAQQNSAGFTGSWLIPPPGGTIIDVSSFFTAGHTLHGLFYDGMGAPAGTRDFTIATSSFTPGVGTVVQIQEVLTEGLLVSYIVDLQDWITNASTYTTAAGVDFIPTDINGHTQSASFHAEGTKTWALDYGAHSEGYHTTARKLYSHAEGSGSQSTGISSHAEGSITIAEGEASHAEGVGSYAIGTGSHAEGLLSQAQGSYSHAEGQATAASGKVSHAEGSQSLAIGTGSHAEGLLSQAQGSYSHTEGSITIAEGEASHAEGLLSQAQGSYSHAEGSVTIAEGEASHAEGSQSLAIGAGSHAEGLLTTASGWFSHTEGGLSNAVGDYAHAEGLQGVSIGTASHAEGDHTTAEGDGAHSEGFYTYALGDHSHTEGGHTTASANYSHAEGSSSVAVGEYSHAEGLHTIAYKNGQLAIGQYNLDLNSTDLFVIGDGTSNASRHDLLNASIGLIRITGSAVVSSSLNVIGVSLVTGSNNITGSWQLIGEGQVTGSMIISNSLVVIGSSQVTGSNSITGSWQLVGAGQITGSVIVSGSSTTIGTNTVIGTSYVSGSNLITGSWQLVGSGSVTGSLIVSNSLVVVGVASLTGSLLVTGSQINIGQSQVTGSLTVSGSLIADYAQLTGSLTGSFLGSGSGHFNGIFTGSLFGTSSWAENVLTASYITGSGVHGPYGSNSVLSASWANTSSYALSSSYTLSASWANTSSYAQYAATASLLLGSIESASYALSSSYALTASLLLGSIESASYAISSSYALTASYFSGSIVSTSYALSASYAVTSSYNLSSSYANNATTASYARTVAAAGDPHQIQFHGTSSILQASANLDYRDTNMLVLASTTDASGLLRPLTGFRSEDLDSTLLNVSVIQSQQTTIARGIAQGSRQLCLGVDLSTLPAYGFLCNYTLLSKTGYARVGTLMCSWTDYVMSGNSADSSQYSLVDTNNIASDPTAEVQAATFDLEYDPAGVIPSASLYLDCTSLVDPVDFCGVFTLFVTS